MNSSDCILLFDGYCVMCSSFAKYLLKAKKQNITVVAMQSVKGEGVLSKFDMERVPDEVVLICNDKVYKGVQAVLHLLKIKGGVNSLLAWCLNLLPNRVLQWFYSAIAKNRYVFFGRRSSCFLNDEVAD
jgi:predicted DCC family thiol-disulfide oxidoreductase YuxK